ncbi:MAG: aminopeptidase P family protein, partial [Kiloniellales bacterium]
MARSAKSRAAYQGDAVLESLLGKARVGLSLAELREFVAGVIAAPPGADPSAWTRLVAPGASPALTAQLQALKAEMEAGPLAADADPAPAERI